MAVEHVTNGTQLFGFKGLRLIFSFQQGKTKDRHCSYYQSDVTTGSGTGLDHQHKLTNNHDENTVSTAANGSVTYSLLHSGLETNDSSSSGTTSYTNTTTYTSPGMPGMEQGTTTTTTTTYSYPWSYSWSTTNTWSWSYSYSTPPTIPTPSNDPNDPNNMPGMNNGGSPTPPPGNNGAGGTTNGANPQNGNGNRGNSQANGQTPGEGNGNRMGTSQGNGQPGQIEQWTDEYGHLNLDFKKADGLYQDTYVQLGFVRNGENFLRTWTGHATRTTPLTRKQLTWVFDFAF